jgi:hypothetical protein
MAQDIVPIQLSLTDGDLVTLWAPKWREDGEEWEAFLGHEDDLYAFDEVAELAAFVRTETEHDLADHPAWHVVPALGVDELTPDEGQRYDLVGVPELVADEPDQWRVGDLADVISMVRSLADVCDLDVVHEVLASAAGFGVLDQGVFPFTGREGERRWTELATAVAERWDEVLDAIDGVVATPEVDAGALDTARKEQAELAERAEAAQGDPDEETGDDQATLDGAETGGDEGSSDQDSSDRDAAERDDGQAEADAPAGFWQGVGIDPISVISSLGQHYTLRCYLDDAPVFLGSDGTIDVFTSPTALARHLAAGAEGAAGHDLASVSTWDDVVTRATNGELEIEVDPENSYVLTGLADDLAEGPEAVDPTQLELAVELVTDAAGWAGDQASLSALGSGEPLGWLVSFIVRPDPTRLAPSPPFDTEVGEWQTIVDDFEERLRVG